MVVSGWWAVTFGTGAAEASSGIEGKAVLASPESSERDRSGLWLSTLAILAAGLFFLKTLRKRPAGEWARLLLDVGGARPVLLVVREGMEESRLDEDFRDSD